MVGVVRKISFVLRLIRLRVLLKFLVFFLVGVMFKFFFSILRDMGNIFLMVGLVVFFLLMSGGLVIFYYLLFVLRMSKMKLRSKLFGMFMVVLVVLSRMKSLLLLVIIVMFGFLELLILFLE